jgi:hypothetical protein
MKSNLAVGVPRSFVLAVSAAFLLSCPGRAAFAQEAVTSKSLEGVWKITQVVKAGVVNNSPQPGLTIFSRGYYSITRVTADEARKGAPAPKDANKLTDAEKIARYEEWAPYGASAGTYEVIGNTLVTHNILAKMVRAMTITEKAAITFHGDSFVAAPLPGEPNSDRQTTYARVQ